MARISVCINSYNSEKTIENTLQSLSKAFEIIVCDMHSTDKTVEIAQKYNAKIVYAQKENFVEKARNFCISQATGDWVFVLDTDEVIPEKLWDFLNNFADEQDKQNGVYTTAAFPIQDHVCGTPIYCMYRKSVKRFWKKGCCENEEVVHGKIKTLQGEDYKIKGRRPDLALKHYHIDSFESYIEKINRYTSAEQERLNNRNVKFNIFNHLFYRPIAEFFKIYIAKQGFRDGKTGFILAIMHSFYQFAKYSKLYEIQILKTKNYI